VNPKGKVGMEKILGGLVFATILIFGGIYSLHAQSNKQPRIDNIGDESVLEDANQQVVNLTGITDSDGGTQIITITATSSKPEIIADSDIIINYTSPQPTGTLSYTPLTDAYGGVIITVTVMDDGGTAGGGIDTYVTNFTVIVNPVNDPPEFTKGSNLPVNPNIILEDAGTQNIFNWATDLNKGGTLENEVFQKLTFTLTQIDTVGSLVFDDLSINQSGTLTFTTSENTNGVARVKIDLQDDGPGDLPDINTAVPDTLVITVTSVNDPPTFTVGPDITISEDASAQLFPAWAKNMSPGGGGDEASQELTFILTQTSTNTITFTSFPVVDAVTGDLTFEVDGDVNGVATIEVTLEDSGPSDAPDQNISSAFTFTIKVEGVNDAPSFSLVEEFSSLEDAGEVSQANIATAISAGPPDEISQTLTFFLNIIEKSGTLTFIQSPSIDVLGTLSFETAPDDFGNAEIMVVLQDDGESDPPHENTSDTLTFTLLITPVNDAPTFTKGSDPTVDEDSGPVLLTSWGQNISPGADNESEQILTFSLTEIGSAGTLSFVSGPTVTSTGDLSFDPAEDANGRISYEIILMDDGSSEAPNVNVSVKETFTINVDAVNDPPTFIVGPDQEINENSGLLTIEGWATGITPGGGPDEANQKLTFSVTPSQIDGNLVFAIGPLVSVGGDLSFQTVPNTFGEAVLIIFLSDDGPSEDPNSNVSGGQSFKITVIEINDPPTDILLSNNAILETVPSGTTVGTFTALDPDDDTHTFTLVDGIGNDDNVSFTIEGDQLVTNTTFDFSIQNLYLIRTSATDGEGSVEAVFLIDILIEPKSTVTFPNAFTPNDDGENDTWDIEDIEYFPTASVSIYNRNGQRIFRSVGYASPWDGTWNGTALPEDTYYVVIDLKNETPVIQGTITILR